jgi:hypothetical protein
MIIDYADVHELVPLREPHLHISGSHVAVARRVYMVWQRGEEENGVRTPH